LIFGLVPTIVSIFPLSIVENSKGRDFAGHRAIGAPGKDGGNEFCCDVRQTF
jgi:hypothetical protein